MDRGEAGSDRAVGLPYIRESLDVRSVGPDEV